MKCWNKQKSALCEYRTSATPEFWDEQWLSRDLKSYVERVGENRLVNAQTKKYLSIGSKVVDAGCGDAVTVYGLNRLGYQAYGVDTAEKTVEQIHHHFPELAVSVEDVRALSCEDGFYDGVWSIGVIEHFWEGYIDILSEAHRVLRPGGYLFLTFPYMSPLRRLKVRLGMYVTCTDQGDASEFYQFFLSKNDVIESLKRLSFDVRACKPLDGTKGLKDEVGFARPILQTIYDSRLLPGKILNFGISKVAGVVAGHSILLICQKDM